MVKRQKTLYIDEEKLEELKNKASQMNVSTNAFIMFKLFSCGMGFAGEAPLKVE